MDTLLWRNLRIQKNLMIVEINKQELGNEQDEECWWWNA
jgi:hypothetical protein